MSYRTSTHWKTERPGSNLEFMDSFHIFPHDLWPTCFPFPDISVLFHKGLHMQVYEGTNHHGHAVSTQTPWPHKELSLGQDPPWEESPRQALEHEKGWQHLLGLKDCANYERIPGAHFSEVCNKDICKRPQMGLKGCFSWHPTCDTKCVLVFPANSP